LFSLFFGKQEENVEEEEEPGRYTMLFLFYAGSA
jgi:hypothetical protein